MAKPNIEIIKDVESICYDLNDIKKAKQSISRALADKRHDYSHLVFDSLMNNISNLWGRGADREIVAGWMNVIEYTSDLSDKYENIVGSRDYHSIQKMLHKILEMNKVADCPKEDKSKIIEFLAVKGQARTRDEMSLLRMSPAHLEDGIVQLQLSGIITATKIDNEKYYEVSPSFLHKSLMEIAEKNISALL